MNLGSSLLVLASVCAMKGGRELLHQAV